jgi:ribose/xylose/arabinose/galactoside ABC-type transport system permease subunit
VALLAIDGRTVTIGGKLTGLGHGEVLGIPTLLLVAVLVLAVIGLAMRYTTFGRDAFAIGGNEEAARLSGIAVRGTKLMLYAGNGLLAGLAGIMLLARLGAASPGSGGLPLELTVVAAVVIGGTALAGGRGTIVGTALGVLLLGVVNNTLNLVQINPFFQDIAVGAVLLVAAIANQTRARC